MKFSLVAVSFLALFLELALIRWLPFNVLSLAYFSNIVLISSFLGLGLGFLLFPRKKDIFKYFPLVLLGVVGLFLCFRYIEVIVPNLKNEMMWTFYFGNELQPGPIQLGILPTLSATFFLTTLLFTLIGHKTAVLMEKFEPLKAYSLDIVGALLGIIAFSALSFVGGEWNTPLIWFEAALVVSVWLVREYKWSVAAGIACIVGMVPLLYGISHTSIWSPYYSIQIGRESEGSSGLFVNRFFHQRILDFRYDNVIKEKYALPYILATPQSVLILGAGSGNDVAMAGAYGVPDIDAVEIDPAIAEIGRQVHPNHPYQNPNVRLYIDDARSFLKKSDKKYDMIVVGTLDSHALLSARSTVRLDNFVYTTESLQEIKKHLNPGGVAVLMFSVPLQWLGDKIVKSVETVFDTPQPIVYAGNSDLFNLMIIAGPGVPAIVQNHPFDTIPFRYLPESSFDAGNISTDDWPYLYLREHVIPTYYLQAIGILLAMSLIGVFLARGRGVQSFVGWDTLNFFCLGGAFLLLEAKSITTLSLLFGSTWLVNAFAFGGILTMVLLANMFVSYVPIRRIGPVYGLLALALLLNYLLPVSMFLGAGFWTQSIVSALIVALPIFFASLIFSFHFKSVGSISTVYGLNLMGAVCGGFLEYSSMITGLNFLYVIAGSIYAVSYAAYRMSTAPHDGTSRS